MLGALPLITYRSQVVGWLAFSSLLSALIAAGGGYYTGYRQGANAIEIKLAKLQADNAVAHADSVKRAANRYVAQVEQEQALAVRLQTTLSALEQTRQPRIGRIDRVSNTYRPTQSVAPIAAPHCVITRGWVRDYNAAFGLSDDSRTATSARSGDATSQARAADSGLLADDLQDSGVNLADLRAHTEDLAAWCRATAAQRDALIQGRINQP